MTRRRSSRPPRPFHLPSRRSLTEPGELPSSGSRRRFLRHLDRELQRFSNRVSSLEEKAARAEVSDGGDLMIAVEALHRETLLLRAEIQEFLTHGGRSLEEMIDYAEETWEQLRDSLAELRENLMPWPPFTPHPTLGLGEESDEESPDEPWTWDADEEESDVTRQPPPEVHPPRIGPKR